MSKAIFSILSMLALLLSGINCGPGRPNGGGGDAPPPTPNRDKVLEIAIEVLQAAEYEIIDKNKGHVRATKGSVDFTLTFLDQPKPCAVRWTIDKSSPPGIQDTQSETVSCVGFRPKLESALSID